MTPFSNHSKNASPRSSPALTRRSEETCRQVDEAQGLSLFNLIDNAAKYAASGEPPLVEIRARKAGRFVELIVSDHGPGIAAPEQGRIFHAFHKSAREAAETQPGVGLGLALSRRLARAMGGDLKCVSGALGACFILSLPSRPPD